MKRGISLVSLMVTLAIMVAIISTVTISGLNTLNNNKKITFATEINMVQNAVDTYKTKNNGEYPVSGTIQLNVSKVTDRAKQQFSDETYLSDNLLELYKIDYSALGITSLRYGSSSDGDTDIYVVSKNTGKVYYAKGLSVSNNTYYTLTDDLSKVIKASDEGEVYDGILFSVSNSDWTLDKVVTKVRVPTSYTNVSVGIVGKPNMYSFVSEGGYNVFTIDDMLSNYVVTVSYTKNGVANTAEYTVDNVDNIPPDFSRDNVKEGYSEEDGNINAFLLLDGYSDTLSGIKEIKFAYSYIEENLISSYFKSNGYKVYNNVIELEEAEKYITIYIEDNVGNFSALYYEISDELYGKLKILAGMIKKAQIGKEVRGQNLTITGEAPTYDNPIIPVGFKAIETPKATWKDSNNDGKPDGWNEGLVITDANYNEYVWIPVDGTNVKYESWNNGTDTAYTVRDNQIEDDTLPVGITSELSQIEKYQGFYVARYEAGLPDSETTDDLMLVKTFDASDNNKTDIGKAQSKPGKIVWNNIDYNNAKIVSENVISNTYVQTGMITEREWDTMLAFIEKAGINTRTDSTAWGNYSNMKGYEITGYYKTQHKDVVYTNGTYRKENDGYLLLQTGKFGEVISVGSPKNLFDVAGNVYEWQASTVKEKGGANTAVGHKIFRSGSYNGDGYGYVPSCRYGANSALSTYPSVGFRFVLYIK